MNDVLKLTTFTHKELINLFDLKCTVKQLSMARRGYPNYLEIVTPMLDNIDVDRLKQAKIKDIENRICKSILDMAVVIDRVQKGEWMENVDAYMRSYKRYVDAKVGYNQRFTTEPYPKYHEELNQLNTKVRARHKRIQDELKRLTEGKKLPEMSGTV